MKSVYDTLYSHVTNRVLEVAALQTRRPAICSELSRFRNKAVVPGPDVFALFDVFTRTMPAVLETTRRIISSNLRERPCRAPPNLTFC